LSNYDDILLDENLDLQIVDGDWVIGDSTKQNQQLLLQCQKGEIKQYPKTGVGINNYLLDEEEQSMLREIRSEFEGDGMLVNKLNYSDEKLTIDAQYSS
jgi:hypothetical protein